MFNLEQAIAEWRQRMRVAGIQSPVPLEELESHLREEIEHKMNLGVREPEAFAAGVAQIGEARLMKTEFAKAGGVPGWLGCDKLFRIKLLLASLGTWGFWESIRWLEYFVFNPQAWPQHFLIFWIVVFLFLAMAIGGITLLRNEQRRGRFITAFAFLNIFGFCLCLLGILWHPLHYPPTHLSSNLWVAVVMIIPSLFHLKPKTTLPT